MRYVLSLRVGRDDEGGSVVAFLAVAAVGLFMVFGLVLDGGRALAAKAADGSAAFSAARAGAEALNASSLYAGTPTLDPSAATSAAQAVLAANGLTGSVSVSGLTVTVAVASDVRTEILSMVGISSVAVSASAAATATPGP